jgi:hypothetical protein
MKKGKIIYVFSLICAFFGTAILVYSKMYLYAIFLAFTIPVLIKKISED